MKYIIPLLLLTVLIIWANYALPRNHTNLTVKPYPDIAIDLTKNTKPVMEWKLSKKRLTDRR